MKKAILRACWQQENEYGRHAARPWLRWFLTCVVGMEVIPTRTSERIRMAKEQYLAVRKEAALKIDPKTAEVFSDYVQTLDPYEMRDLPEDYPQRGREYFARSPGSDVWVWFGDLPAAVRDRLWARVGAGEFADDDKWWAACW